MNHTESLTRYVGHFIDELVASGVDNIVISPGSRSTPLAMTAAEHTGMNHWIQLDERSAAFFALGMAKQQKKPVALVCTSGTAAANYYPAIIEAYYSRVPLVILTADRPHELRNVGAPQAIDQIHMYSHFVKWFQEVALPESSDKMLRYIRSIAARACHTASDGNQGPVHLNFPFREPLVPDFTLENVWGRRTKGFQTHIKGKRHLDPQNLAFLKQKIQSGKKGLIVCGPQWDGELPEQVTQLAKVLQLPILADPLSQIRAGEHEKDHVIESYDAILKSTKLRGKMKPDFIIRFGAMPVSKPYMLMLKENQDISHFVVEDFEGHREPTTSSTEFIYADGKALCKALAQESSDLFFDKEWLKFWQDSNRIAKATLLEDRGEEPVTEGHVFSELMELLPEQGTIYVGNSMPIRDLDTFMFTSPKSIRVLANRGVNGIDGLASSALGAAAHGEEVTLILGDLSFFHDLNGLLVAKQYGIRLRIIVINNQGGGIFSFLPQAQHPDHFEALFGTPLDIDFEKVVSMYGGAFSRVESWSHLREELLEIREGLSVIEVMTRRDENANWHRSKWKAVEEAIENEIDDL
ncbi:2-succinyl-5-enolpyruvyl-6-hydroxy-3-cyclohexene-1-carboxylic-acid synthase [Pontibacillus sp. HMF3514]|uniref:2-succinyl-5-enolpyruvyl-6-hydroxy-3- cyclohexene-1-carboxylic-acid synthase n=1 Tax=Pontibacillus sp. HMF3514 TaxID=2692425 RepID=UPI00131F8E6E|nr:2-succinyl-5-enolpyruvyl-6-hydroxy-3-cyclohexene-1-carboxylic-acid synthase [Pontibacillus sp. HMF3514]QHE53347.1 2-succinyl-5-enolpyruvyl-6-hydroxy-3-cyclohexene-1-carboxylic-acid synthase [Pontibacillus sp. HMF3514]